MEFELQQSEQGENTESKAFIKKNYSVKSQKDFYSEIVEELLPRNLNYVQLIDSYFFASQGSFDDNSCLQLLQGKIDELKEYSKSAIIFDLDSLIKLNRSVSQSSTGPSTSFSIDRPTLYKDIITYATGLMTQTKNKELWVVVMVKDSELASMVRNDISWPLSAQQKKEKFEKSMKEEKEKKDK